MLINQIKLQMVSVDGQDHTQGQGERVNELRVLKCDCKRKVICPFSLCAATKVSGLWLGMMGGIIVHDGCPLQ